MMLKIWSLLVMLLLVSNVVAVDETSEDYKAGFYDAARGYNASGGLSGMLASTLMTLELMDGVADKGPNTEVGAFCRMYVDKTTPVYNEMVTEYNILCDQQNTLMTLILGEDYPGIDKILLEHVEYFRP